MKYWVHINNELQGPFGKEEAKALAGFGPETLVCPEAPADGEAPAWKPASSCQDFFPVTAPEPPKAKPAESPLMMTMRGTLIEAEAREAVKKAETEPPKPPQAESPIGMTMRGTLIEPGSAEAAAPAAPEPPKPAPPAAKEGPAPAGATLASLAAGQAQLLERVERVEKLMLEMRSLLFPSLPKKD